MTIKVLIVDDSAVVREVLTQVLSHAADIEVIGSCSDPIFAQQKMKLVWPDVVVLDIEMPRMDGLTFLRQIMAQRPTPVVICSSLTEKGATITLDALSAGAVAIVTKPTMKLKSFLEDSAADIVLQVRAAAAARMTKVRTSHTMASGPPPRTVSPKLTADAVLPLTSGRSPALTSDRIIALGTSTGGTQALEYLLPRLPVTVPGIAVVQHMPAQFTASFARRLDSICDVEVKEAQTGDKLLPGVVLVAPGGRHLTIRRSNNQYVADVKDGPLVSRHRPSVDVLFRSVAIHAGRNAVGVIMTGMGDDGARGMREMHNAGARTIAQDEESSVVFGMPKEAIALGGVLDVMSLDGIATMLSGMKT